MTENPDAKIILEDGQEYLGRSFGSRSEKILEIVFNTSLVGYQEIMSDPSYTDQAVVMTYPIIGSYGMAPDDYETDVPTVGALIVREYNGEPSNFRSEETLGAVMERYGICGIEGVDTRKLTRSIRDLGSRMALLTGADVSLEEGLRRLKGYAPPHGAVSRVSCREQREYRGDAERFHVAAIDCGMKKNIIRCLTALGCRVTVVPWDTPAELIRSLRPAHKLVWENGQTTVSRYWNPDLSPAEGNPEDLVRELIDHESYGLKSYQALWMRIQNEIVSKRMNRFADVLDLDRLADQVYTPDILCEMSEKLVRVLRMNGIPAVTISEKDAEELEEAAVYGSLGLPYLVNRKVLTGGADHV